MQKQIENQIEQIEKNFHQKLQNTIEHKDLIEIKIEFLGKNGHLQKVKNLIINNNLQTTMFNYFQDKQKSMIKQLEHSILMCLNKQKPTNIKLPIYESYGTIHPITLGKNLLTNLLCSYGFEQYENKEIDSMENCFDKLNINKKHPCRNEFQSFFLENGQMLTPHTSNSQIHLLNLQKDAYKHFVIGKTYRRDLDATHSPMFHQVELFYVDNHINIKYMINFIKDFLQTFFQKTFKTRFRPSYFPFTEPSLEVDIYNDEQQQWLEVGGCGLISHNVFKLNNHQDKQGFAFGFGLERLIMLKYNISDIRSLYGVVPIVNGNILNTRSCL